MGNENASLKDFTNPIPIGQIHMGTIEKLTPKKELLDKYPTENVAWIKVDKKQHPINEEFKKTIERLYRIPHPNIAKCYGILENRHHAFILHSRGEMLLSDIIKDLIETDNYLQEQAIWNIATQLSLALHAIHTSHIHRDVIPDNVYISGPYQCYLQENPARGGINKDITLTLGVIGLYRTTEQLVNLGGRDLLQFMIPPEVLGQSKDYNKTSDVWCMGFLLWYLATRQIPFTNIADVCTGIPKTPWPEHYSQELKYTILSLLNADPKIRTSISAFLCVPQCRANIGKLLPTFTAENLMYLPTKVQFCWNFRGILPIDGRTDHDFFFKIALFGDKGVGKTTLVNTFARNTTPATPTKWSYPTLVPVSFEDGRGMLQVWDTAGLKVTQKEILKICKNTPCLIFVFSLTQIHTWTPLEIQVKRIREQLSPCPQIIILGTHADQLHSRADLRASTMRFCESIPGAHYEEIDCTDSNDVDFLFLYIMDMLLKKVFSFQYLKTMTHRRASNTEPSSISPKSIE
ncbi:putative Protein kinase domain containing protein [Blattamonas nauphoetae]|uniref:non-specific serine/threonine protein kinase n=1 Tax=Blattamonas nauphoetae TaxID=2049346 RepID=A0ABQ9YF92_9EUKA|nr:putative Protein kinase domain containing protein [Blattamonas nauphoetae]